MWFYVMPHATVIEPKEDDGLMISFGNSDDAGGMGSSSQPLAAPESETLTPAVQSITTPAPQAKEQLITQNDNSNVIKEQKQKVQLKKEKQRIDQQKLENEKTLAQQKKKEQEAINKASANVNGVFSNGSSTSGTGNGKGSGNGTGTGAGNGSEPGIQGSITGHGNSNGNNWSLEGRSLIGGIVKPRYDSSTIGKITVQIYVDSNGNVTDATIYRPTTISDVEMRNDAIKAAKKVKFSRGEGRKYGTITYKYVNT